MATYGSIVPLMQDLKSHLSSSPFACEELSVFSSWKQDVQLLYGNICLMDSLLRDSTGQSYFDPELINKFENRITNVLHRAGSYVDLGISEYYCYGFEFLEKRSLDGLGMFEENSLVDSTEDLEMDLNLFQSTIERRIMPARSFWSIKSRELERINKEIDCVNEELKKTLNDGDRPPRNLIVPDTVSSTIGKSLTLFNPSQKFPNKGDKLVGLENDTLKMLDCLTGLPLKLQVFAVTGMAGIGKTTFSRRLYNHPLVMHHFHVRAWVTVSQQYQLKEMLLCLISCISHASDEIYESSPEQLRERVYKSFKGKRYLIILDDMWDDKAWDDLKMIFPDDKIGSRIILTTRLKNVAINVSPDSVPHALQCLSLNESWELLCSKIFVNHSCPQELVKMGKQIACKCQGLPLAIVVVGGLLSKMDKTLKVWEEVAQSVSSLVMNGSQHCEDILSLSYNHLPDPLKTCFLYLGVFPEDYEIPAQKLIWLWIAEGFIQPTKQKMLEEVAEDYLEDLITRSLVMVRSKRSNGKIKICCIHDLMRDLCLRKSHDNHFLGVFNSYKKRPLGNQHNLQIHPPTDYIRQAFETNMHILQRVSFHRGFCKHLHSLYRSPTQLVRSCFCFETLRLTDHKGRISMSMSMRMSFKVLRVLDIMHVDQIDLPRDILYLVHLRYLAFNAQNSSFLLKFGLLNILSKLHNLQTIIACCIWDGLLPWVFWDMPEIRHCHLKSSHLPRLSGPTRFHDFESSSLLSTRKLPNLLSLSAIRPINCTKRIFLSMPKLMKLGIHETEDDCQFRGWFKNLVHLPELESLKYIFSNPFVPKILRPDRLPSHDVFPPKLVKLTLSGTSLPWEDMFILSMLPRLEVLKLRNYAFSGKFWKAKEGGFACLKYLLIGSTDLELWEANGNYFPTLQHLVLRHCRSLTEIPYDIGKAPLIEKIELHCCRDSASASARQIKEEQQSLGNDWLTVYIT